MPRCCWSPTTVGVPTVQGGALPFSRLLGRPVQDASGFVLGRLADLAVEVRPTQPRVVGVLLDVDRPRVALIPWGAVRQLEPVVVLSTNRAALAPRPLQPDEVLLREALLDKQVVDTQGVRLVKVNDLLLSPANGDLVLSGVDVGAAGLLRRLGVEGAVRWRASAGHCASTRSPGPSSPRSAVR